MAAGDVTIGRRIPVPESGDINEILFDFEPGDYCGPGYLDAGHSWREV